MRASDVNAEWAIDSEEEEIKMMMTLLDGEEVLAEKDRFFETKSVTVAISTMQGHESALKWRYRIQRPKVFLSPEINEWLCDLMAGNKLIVASKKKKEGLWK
jgi:hypothetical protein